MIAKRGNAGQTGRAARVTGCLAWSMVLLVFAGGGYWGYRQWEKGQEPTVEEKVAWPELEKRLGVALEKRRLEEAESLVLRMERAGAGPEALGRAQSLVAQGRAEEKGQEIAFLVLNARSAVEAGRLSEAERFCSQVERLEPDHPATGEIRTRIQQGRRTARKNLMVAEIEKALVAQNWATARAQLEALGRDYPAEPRVADLRKALELARAEWQERRARAAGLVAKARALDQGIYSEEAMRLLAEAVRLDPSESNRALYRKMSTYGKMIKVPGDFETITAALESAKANDRIMIGKGTFHESLRLPAGVVLVGGSKGETVLECPAGLGAVVTVPSEVKGARLVSLTLRHSGLVSDDERFPVVAVDGGELEAVDLRVVRASGHGVAVVKGGRVRLQRCQIIDSGWDGVAIKGRESHAELVEIESIKNLQHGVDFWNGASGTVRDSLLSENGLNGFLSIDAEKAIAVTRIRSEKNHEVGMVIAGGVGATLKGCEIKGNLLGGIFLGGGAKEIRWLGNRVEDNGEAGVVLEKGVQIVSEEDNAVTGNEGRQIWRDAVLPEGPAEQTGAPPPAPPLDREDGE